MAWGFTVIYHGPSLTLGQNEKIVLVEATAFAQENL